MSAEMFHIFCLCNQYQFQTEFIYLYHTKIPCLFFSEGVHFWTVDCTYSTGMCFYLLGCSQENLPNTK